MTAMVAVEIVGIHMDPTTGTSAVLLGDPESMTRVLPIMIGPAEAQAIVMALAGIEPPRPLTHDLTTTLLSLAGARVEEVVVTELLESVFHAELFIETATGMHSVSARPSDSIALAIRVGAPIFVRESVLAEAAVPVERESSQPLADDEVERIVDEFQEFLAGAQPSDFELPDTDVDDDPADDEPSDDEPD